MTFDDKAANTQAGKTSGYLSSFASKLREFFLVRHRDPHPLPLLETSTIFPLQSLDCRLSLL